MASEPSVHRLLRVFPILICCILMFATLAIVLNPAQATHETGISANEVGPESLTAASADWPMPFQRRLADAFLRQRPHQGQFAGDNFYRSF